MFYEFHSLVQYQNAIKPFYVLKNIKALDKSIKKFASIHVFIPVSSLIILFFGTKDQVHIQLPTV